MPSLSPGGTIDDTIFLGRFLDDLRARGQADLLAGAWQPVHNYFLNPPIGLSVRHSERVWTLTPCRNRITGSELTAEQIESINHARKIAKLPRELGASGLATRSKMIPTVFRKFEAYARIFYSRFGSICDHQHGGWRRDRITGRSALRAGERA